MECAAGRAPTALATLPRHENIMATADLLPNSDEANEAAQKARAARVARPAPPPVPFLQRVVPTDCSNCGLRAGHFFCSLSPESVQALDKIKQIIHYPARSLIVVEGQPSRGVHIVCRGEVKVLAGSCDGRTMIVSIVQSGEVLGLSAVMAGTPHELTAETLKPTQAAFIARDDFLRFLHHHPAALLQATQLLAREAQFAYDVIRNVGLSPSMSARLARLLLQLSHRGIYGLSHEELAQLVGTRRETVTRTLTELKRQGIMRTGRFGLVIGDKAGLERISHFGVRLMQNSA
jgi:CRP/FNR family cyclic AMP-dependent transcriptional regulator